MKAKQNISILAVIGTLLFQQESLANCAEAYNPDLALYEYRCDDLDDYPDYYPEDNHDTDPDSWNSGHQAGYEWAINKGIYNSADCTGKSRSFVEGCLRYVQGY